MTIRNDRPSSPKPSSRCCKVYGSPVVRIGISTLLLTLLIVATVGSGYELAQAQSPTDFTKLTLEELMRVDVVSINVLGTHIHPAGQWMLGYEYMFENMDGNRDGTHRISRGRVLDRFATAPTDMTMQTHMAMLMYAPTNDFTLMAMLPYILKSMNHIMRDGTRFTERTEGIGDLQVRGLYTFHKIRGLENRFLFNAAVSIPTGSIDEKDFGPDRSLGENRLEYPMQLGSGTVDLLPGLTYLGQTENWAFTTEFIPTVRLGRNAHEYRLGNRYRLSAWVARKWTDWLSLSGRFDGERWENIHGADRTLDPSDEPTKDPHIQGGKRIDLLFGINVYAPSGVLKGHRLAVEVGAPVYQSLKGPQLQTDWLLRVGWNLSF